MQPLCLIEDIDEGDARGFNLNGSAIIAIKKQGELYLYQNSCPHRGINLEWQPDQFLDPDRQLIQCASHGALFLIESGQCVQGPCFGEHLKPIKFSVQDKQVLVELPDTLLSPNPQAGND